MIEDEEGAAILDLITADIGKAMKFEQALDWMRKGQKVGRAGWTNRRSGFGGRTPLEYIRIDEHGQMWGLALSQETEFPLRMLNARSILAEDWKIVE